MGYNLAEAGAAVGRNRSTILKAIKKGLLSASRDALGGWSIEPSELHRVYPPVADETSRHSPATPDNGEIRELRAEVRGLREAIRFRDETLADLRRRLDRADERLLMLLADQRAAAAKPIRWWRPWTR